MNWINFKEQRPKKMPKRQIIVRFPDGSHGIWWSFQSDGWNTDIAHWAEIEPPPEPDPLDYEITMSPEDIRITKIAPKPDPFEQWMRSKEAPKHIPRPLVRTIWDAGWDAAIKWKEGQK